MPSRKLDDLAPECRSVFFALLARIVESGIPIVIINTLRSKEEQAHNIANGVSWTTNSKHLPQPPSGKSYAIDICPFSVYAVHGASKLDWDSNDPVWQKLGAIGEALGLRWGGRWKQKDMGHFEYQSSTQETSATSVRTS